MPIALPKSRDLAQVFGLPIHCITTTLLVLLIFSQPLSAAEKERGVRLDEGVRLDGGRFSNGDIKFGTPKVSGNLSPNSFLGVAHAKKAGLLYCYDKEVREGILIWGEVELEIGLDQNGKVLDSEWSRSVPRMEFFGTCVKRMVKRWQFSTGPARIVFPLSISTSTFPK